MERKVDFNRSNLFVPVPHFTEVESYNRKLLMRHEKKATELHYKKQVPIGDLFEEDRKALLMLPPKRFQVCRYEWLKADGYGKVCMDVGASTGGFTDCMLQNGAVKVYSVDVGHGQLDWKLRNDPRVVCMERTNIRYVVTEDIEERPSFVSIDVSFISLTKVLLPVRNLMEENGEIAALIKPQFEAGREKVGKKGVVRDPAVHKEVIEMVISYAKSISFGVRHLEFSPIKGPEGNIEYLVHLVRLPDGVTEEETNVDVDAVVKSAHDTLDK